MLKMRGAAQRSPTVAAVDHRKMIVRVSVPATKVFAWHVERYCRWHGGTPVASLTMMSASYLAVFTAPHETHAGYSPARLKSQQGSQPSAEIPRGPIRTMQTFVPSPH